MGWIVSSIIEKLSSFRGKNVLPLYTNRLMHWKVYTEVHVSGGSTVGDSSPCNVMYNICIVLGVSLHPSQKPVCELQWVEISHPVAVVPVGTHQPPQVGLSCTSAVQPFNIHYITRHSG